METKRSAGSLALKAVLALFFLFAVLLPLIRMLSNMATHRCGRNSEQSAVPFGGAALSAVVRHRHSDFGIPCFSAGLVHHPQPYPL